MIQHRFEVSWSSHDLKAAEKMFNIYMNQIKYVSAVSIDETKQHRTKMVKIKTELNLTFV